MGAEKILRNTPSTQSVTFYSGETATNADSHNVSVVVKDLQGNTVTSGAASFSGTTGKYNYVLTGQATLRELVLTWSFSIGGSPGSVETYVEIVGGFYFTPAELRKDPAITTVRYTLDDIVEARDFVEKEFEDFCDRAFVLRGYREVLSGDGTTELWLSKREPYVITKLEFDGVDVLSSKTIVRSDEASKLLLIRDDVWPSGTDNILIEYEYGMRNIPTRVKNVALLRARSYLTSSEARYDMRATRMEVEGFGTVSIAQPGKRGVYTGIPQVDVVLDYYNLDNGGVG